MADGKAKSKSKQSTSENVVKKTAKPPTNGTKAGASSKLSAKSAKKPKSATALHRSKVATTKTKTKTSSMAAIDPLEQARGKAASLLIDQRIRELTDWRGQTLARMRKLILEAIPEMVEEWKWRGTPVWSHNGIVCTGESYAKVIKLTFAKGASISDPAKLFNSSLEGNTRRAIDIREGEEVDANDFKTLIKAAAALNSQSTKKKAATSRPKVKLLSGGNPQIAKADGDAPVQAYIAAMPGWKNELGKRLDTIIEQNVPNLSKAIKWNSPFYGVEGQGWFLSFHVFTRYVKVAFFRGSSLRPLPPGPSKSEDTRYIDIHENDLLDEAQFASWVKQAAALPGYLGKPS